MKSNVGKIPQELKRPFLVPFLWQLSNPDQFSDVFIVSFVAMESGVESVSKVTR